MANNRMSWFTQRPTNRYGAVSAFQMLQTQTVVTIVTGLLNHPKFQLTIKDVIKLFFRNIS